MFFIPGKKKIPVPPLLREVARVFHDHQKKVFLVGGAVRDMLRGKTVHDWDLATDALAEEVSTMFRRVIPTGIRHGTVTIIYKGRSIEVTTFRTEGAYSDGRRPDTIQFVPDIEADLSRRDFTMNAIAASLPDGSLVDPFNGRADIKKGIIRCAGDPLERFGEDGLRPLRAIRFAVTLHFALHKTILAAIPQRLSLIQHISFERIRDELQKMLLADEAEKAFLIMRETGILPLLLPELSACVNVEQKGYHRFDVFTHSLLALRYAAHKEYSLAVRLAALLHDTGKPARAKRDEQGIWTFYNHEKESAKLAQQALTRLRFPNELIHRVCHLIEEHMFHYEEVWSDAAVRRFLIRAGEEYLDELLQLRICDTFAAAGVMPNPELLLPFRRRIEQTLAKSSALSLKNLAVNGRDLMQAGISGGKQLGIILEQLLQAVLEDPALNSREQLLKIALSYNEMLSSAPANQKATGNTT